MELVRKTNIDFLGKRRFALVISSAMIIAGIVSLFVQGLNFGVDFTGGTLVEVSYHESVDISKVRRDLGDGGIKDAQVQYFGTARDVMVRLQVSADKKAAEQSAQVMEALRRPFGEVLTDASQGGGTQRCAGSGGAAVDCKVQMRRVEVVGPQVGEELTEQGGLAMLYALIGILIYVAWRFEWRLAVGSVAALVHDVLITIGMFSILQMEFSLSVLAAILAVIGYSLNDTIVVFDRIRENFRKMRKSSAVDIMNVSINQTLSRTVLTSATTLLVLLSLFFLGGEVIRGFAAALVIGIVVGTYSSIFVASPLALVLGISREDMLPVQKEGADQQNLSP